MIIYFIAYLLEMKEPLPSWQIVLEVSNEEEWTNIETRNLVNVYLQGAVTCNSCRLIFFSNIDKTDKLLADLRKKRADSQR